LLLPARFGYASPFTSPLTGGGTLNVTVEYVRDYFSGNWSAFTGKINVSAPASGAYYTTGDFRINNANGYANAAIFLNNSVNMYNINANGQTTDIGELGGSATAFIGAGGSINPTWRIGAKNTTNTYAGVIADAGVTSLIKTGTGMLILSGINNAYSGNTTINGGTLKVINTNGTATGFGTVTVANGGTLAGNGIISGPVTVNSGGALAPGNPLGPLTITNSLTLSAGSTTFMQVQHSPLTNDSVTVLGTLIEGGTLNVTNSGAATLANGDIFQLFSAGAYSGSFTALVLPLLNGNLVWNTSNLQTSGTLSVMALSQPTIGNINITGGNMVVGGTGGPNGWTYYLLASTNLNLPAAQWTRIATNQFNGDGTFSVTNLVDITAPQTFYQIQLQ
jgi:autotransporter-associated beta strand protein